jgi:glycosyltransferase involved in cell wall biosynthesis
LGRLKHITVVSWDMGHNAVGRPYFFADMLRRRYDSVLLGPMFPQFGDGIWEPIRKSEVRMLAFPGANLPEYVDQAERAIDGLQTDLVIACKPRFPALLIAMMLRRSHGVPVIADLDEWELSWTGANDGLTVDEVESRRGERNLERPYGPVWTRAAEELLGDADAVTVASPVLQDIYGGTIVAQTRDEQVFDPGRYDREAVRAEFGYTTEDRVVLFLGTPRRFKGLLELAQALEELGDPRYKLCVIGTIRDPADRIELARVAAGRTQVVEYRPVSEVPRLTVIGDLVCLLQDATHRTTEHQLPAKLTEVLAMGVPVLARETPPLEPLVGEGLISGIGEVSVATRIAELFSDPDGMRARAQRGRQYFLDELCYSATLQRLGTVFAGLEDSRGEMPPNWERAYELARSVPPGADATSPVVAADDGASGTLVGDLEIVGNDFVQGRVEQVKDGLVTGWAWNPATPDWRVGVRVVVDGLDVAGGAADLDHLSLAEDGVGDGRHGFRIKLPARVAVAADHGLRIEAGGARLPAATGFEVVVSKPSSSWAGVGFSLEDPVTGRLERVRDGVVTGWACRADDLGWRAEIRVIVDGAEVATARADHDRPELAGSGLGDGRHGFEVALPAELATEPSHTLRVETTGGVSIAPSASFVTDAQDDGGLWQDVEFHPEGAVLGRVEQAEDGIVAGWAYRSGAPSWRVWVRAIVDGVDACSGLADLDREKLAADFGDGRHGFRFELSAVPPRTRSHRVLVEAEGVALPATTPPSPAHAAKGAAR